MNKSVATLLLIAGLALPFSPLSAQEQSGDTLPDNVPGLLVSARTFYNAKDFLSFRKTMERLHQMRPNNSDYMYQLVLAYALLDEKTPAYNLMLHMQQQGLSYDFTKSENSMNIRNTEVFDYVNDLLVKAGEPFGMSELVFTLPADVTMPETISWDESRQKFLIGTVTHGSILAVGEDGQVEELLRANDENGLWSVVGILVDQAQNRLWVSSAATPGFARYDLIDKGRSALFEFNLETLELVRRYPVPVDGQPHMLGSMALSPNGDIYIVDRRLPIIYMKAAGEQKLEAVIASNEMVSMRGIAIQPDGKMMYVADRELGILVLDLVGERALRLGVPATLNLGGIDGLYLSENLLVVIQNGIKPQRVMRLQLDDSGTAVETVRPLAVAQPGFDFPNFGVLRGKDLYYFGNSQWAANENDVKPVSVLRTSLDSGNDLEALDINKVINRMAREHEAPQKNADAQEEGNDKEAAD